MNYKSFEVKADESGTIAGFFSTYEKTPDSYGDIIVPGAFTNTLAKRKETGHPFPLCFNHDFDKVIGVVDEIEEKAEGPYINGHFLDTALAQDVRKFVQSGAVYQFSFAYDIVKRRDPSEEEVKNGVTNVLEELEVYEISVVTVPANQNAVVTDIKMYVEEFKAGRRNSKKDADAIREAIALLQGVLDEQPADEDEVKEIEPEVNEASEEPKEDENLKKSASSLLEVINLMKGDSTHES